MAHREPIENRMPADQSVKRLNEECYKQDIRVKPSDTYKCPPDVYKNLSKPRGSIFISNGRLFDDQIASPERNGSFCDIINVKTLFWQIGYGHTDIPIVENPARNEFLEALDHFNANDIHEDEDSLVCLFMSHGKNDMLLARNEELIMVQEICSKFSNSNCPLLKDKPKVLIFECCRGSCRTGNIEVEFETSGRSVAQEPTIYPSDIVCDTFLCFSTLPNNVSYRHKYSGSVYIQELCKVFAEKAHDTSLVELYSNINTNLYSSCCRQSCEIRLLGVKQPFYFNPIMAQTEESPSNTKRVQSLKQHASENYSDENEMSTVQGASAVTSASDGRLAEGSASKGKQTFSNSVVANSSYSSDNCSRGHVFFLNNIEGCAEDVKRLTLTFERLDYKCIIMPTVQTYESLKMEVKKHEISANATVIVFFFGYGYDDYLLIGNKSDYSVPFKKFIEAFKYKRIESSPTVLFTNTCFKYKTQETKVYTIPQESIWDTFHVCVKVNGCCSKGSLLTEVIVKEFEKIEAPEEFAEFSSHITYKISELQESDPDNMYLTDIRYLGVRKHFYFRPPFEGQMNRSCNIHQNFQLFKSSQEDCWTVT